MTVSDIDLLRIPDGSVFVREMQIGWVVLQTTRKTFSQPTGWRDASGQEIRDRTARGRPAEISFKYRRYPVGPGYLHRRPVHQHHDGFRPNCQYGLEQLFLCRGEAHVRAVVPFGFNPVGQSEEYHCNVCFRGGLHSLIQQIGGGVLRIRVTSRCVVYIRQECSQFFQRDIRAPTGHTGTPAPLHARAILGLPIDTTLVSPGACTIIRGEVDLAQALSVPESDVRHYVDFPALALATADTVDQARDRAVQVAASTIG